MRIFKQTIAIISVALIAVVLMVGCEQDGDSRLSEDTALRWNSNDWDETKWG